MNKKTNDKKNEILYRIKTEKKGFRSAVCKRMIGRRKRRSRLRLRLE